MTIAMEMCFLSIGTKFTPDEDENKYTFRQLDMLKSV